MASGSAFSDSSMRVYACVVSERIECLYVCICACIYASRSDSEYVYTHIRTELGMCMQLMRTGSDFGRAAGLTGTRSSLLSKYAKTTGVSTGYPSLYSCKWRFVRGSLRRNLNIYARMYLYD